MLRPLANSPARTTIRSRNCSARSRPVRVPRGTTIIAGQPNRLTITTPLNGSVRITGQIGNTAGKAAGGIGGVIGNLIGGNAVGKQIEDLAVKTLDQRTDFRRQCGGDIEATADTVMARWNQSHRPARFG